MSTESNLPLIIPTLPLSGLSRRGFLRAIGVTAVSVAVPRGLILPPKPGGLVLMDPRNPSGRCRMVIYDPLGNLVRWTDFDFIGRFNGSPQVFQDGSWCEVTVTYNSAPEVPCS